jgi:hypothetical protein
VITRVVPFKFVDTSIGVFSVDNTVGAAVVAAVGDVVVGGILKERKSKLIQRFKQRRNIAEIRRIGHPLRRIRSNNFFKDFSKDFFPATMLRGITLGMGPVGGGPFVG